MSKNYYWNCHCSVHDIDFARNKSEHADEPGVVECPVCIQVERNLFRNQLNKVRDQRDALLRAIEIKNTVIIK